MLLVVQTALELGFLYAPVALALFLSFRVLDIADLTTDGCFVLGAAVSVTLTAAGHPLLAVPAAMLAGACAGFITAFLQTRLSVPSILAGIVTNTGLYTINLMAMGWRSNESLLRRSRASVSSSRRCIMPSSRLNRRRFLECHDPIFLSEPCQRAARGLPSVLSCAGLAVRTQTCS